MSNRTHLGRAGRVGTALAVCFAFLAVPLGAQAATVDLGTAGPFVVLGGSAVTNTGPSVLNGDLGVFSGTSLTGFGGPPDGVVNGDTHNADFVAQQAQGDLTTAYGVAAGEPFTTDLTGTDLGLAPVLTPGVYRFSSSAQLTGAVTLDAQGDLDAQFIFQIGSTLTTASASSVVLIGGASACNVYWQIGSSATLGTDTAFQGNLMADASITLNNGASVIGRALARTGAVTLDTNVLNSSGCSAGSSTPPPDGTPPDGTPPNDTPPDATPPGGPGSTSPGSPGATRPGGPGSTSPGSPGAKRPRGKRPPASTRRNGTATIRRSPRGACSNGFRARVRGHLIRRVAFRLNGRRIASRAGSPFQVFVRAAPGRHKITARVTFKDGTRAKTMTLRYRACADAPLHPRRGPSRFTG